MRPHLSCNTTRAFLFLLAIAALASSLSAPASAGVAYSQSFDGTGNGYNSQNDPNGLGLFAISYDNFVLSSNTKLSQIQWTGFYYNPPVPGAITDWTVTFYHDSGNLPADPCCTYNVAGSGNETFLGNFGGVPIYTYSMDLNELCCFNAGTEYWVSVVPTLGYPPEWRWATATGGDGIAAQAFFGPPVNINADFAFQLSGDPCDPTPEPGTLALLGTGAIGAAGAARRRFFTA